MAATCPNCEGEELDVMLTTRLSDHAPLDGRLRKHDVVPMVLVHCTDCSETIKTIESDEELYDFIRHGTLGP